MQEEMKLLVGNEMWDVMDIPSDPYLVEFKWVFIIKYKSDKMIVRFKVRLVAEGFRAHLAEGNTRIIIQEMHFFLPSTKQYDIPLPTWQGNQPKFWLIPSSTSRDVKKF